MKKKIIGMVTMFVISTLIACSQHPIETSGNIGASFPNDIKLQNTTLQPAVTRKKAIDIAEKWFRDANEVVGGNYPANATVALYNGPYKPSVVEPPIVGNYTPVWVVVIPGKSYPSTGPAGAQQTVEHLQDNFIIDARTGGIIYVYESRTVVPLD